MKKTKCPKCGFLFQLADVSASASILGRKGGAVKSDRKTHACQANGLKGGRPRKVKDDRPGRGGIWRPVDVADPE